MADRQYLELLSRKLADEGRLVEAGWVAMRIQCVPHNAPVWQLHDMRMAYMAGAQHLFASIMTILDDGVEETEADLTRMDLIAKELEVFAEELKLHMAKVAGRG
jgi:hypothetical protein